VRGFRETPGAVFGGGPDSGMNRRHGRQVSGVRGVGTLDLRLPLVMLMMHAVVGRAQTDHVFYRV
jgi:hypothetical protein